MITLSLYIYRLHLLIKLEILWCLVLFVLFYRAPECTYAKKIVIVLRKLIRSHVQWIILEYMYISRVIWLHVVFKYYIEWIRHTNTHEYIWSNLNKIFRIDLVRNECLCTYILFHKKVHSTLHTFEYAENLNSMLFKPQ